MQEFSIQLKCLKFIGFWNVVDEKYKTLLEYFQRLNILIIFYCLGAEVLFAIQNFKNIFVLAECLSFMSTEIITCAKILTFYFFNEDFSKMINKIRELSEKGELKIFILGLRKLF